VNRVALHPGRVVFMVLLAIVFNLNQIFFYYTDTPGVDYAYYHMAASSIRDHGSPYSHSINYIYPPLLSILVVPLSYLTKENGYPLWAILTLAGLWFGVFRSGYVGFCSRAAYGTRLTSRSTTDKSPPC
jgi:hypothetical protein